MNIKEIGEAIRVSREEKGVTQTQMANDLGMSNATLSRLENGRLSSDLGALRLFRCISYVGLDVKLEPRKFGYTLEDAQRDNLEEGLSASGPML